MDSNNYAEIQKSCQLELEKLKLEEVSKSTNF